MTISQVMVAGDAKQRVTNNTDIFTSAESYKLLIADSNCISL